MIRGHLSLFLAFYVLYIIRWFTFQILKGGISMSLPNIPDIDPNITLSRCETIHLLLSSIAMEEISLSHILNAEGEKLQAFIKKEPDCLDDYLKINDSILKTLRAVVSSQILLNFKLNDVLTLDSEHYCKEKDKKKCSCKKPHTHQSCNSCEKYCRSLKSCKCKECSQKD